MVTSNLRKAAGDPGSLRRLGILAAIIFPLAIVAVGSLWQWPAAKRNFLVGWIVAALDGFFSVPQFYLHYALPLLVPLCLAASAFFARPTLGPVSFALIATMAFVAFPFFDFERTRYARQGMDELVAAIEQHKDGGALLVYDGPPLLYTMTDERFPGPLAFPNHLHQREEKDVSHLSTLAEVRRVLAQRPGAVVVRSGAASNRETAALVADYIARNCRKVASVALTVDAPQRVEVHAGCRRGAKEKAGAKRPGLS
jgi:hypothetical protein